MEESPKVSIVLECGQADTEKMNKLSESLGGISFSELIRESLNLLSKVMEEATLGRQIASIPWDKDGRAIVSLDGEGNVLNVLMTKTWPIGANALNQK